MTRAPRQRSTARVARFVLGTLLALGVLAPWIAPRSPDLQEDVAGSRLLPPLTSAHALHLEPERLRIVTRLRRTAEGWEYLRAGRAETIEGRRLISPPSPRFYLLGTDTLGRDLTSCLLFGLRRSAGVVALAVALALLVGSAVGTLCGLAGGWTDAVVMRGVDLLLSIPRLLLFLLLATRFQPSGPLLVLVLGGTTWTGLARIVRAETMSLKQSELLTAARAVGAPVARLWIRHLLPQLGPVLAVAAALRFADTLILESALSFLGLGAPPPAVSLGGILAAGREPLGEGWWVVLWPGVLITTLVLTLRSAVATLFSEQEPASLA